MAHEQVQAYVTALESIHREILAELASLERHELRYATGNARWNTVRRVLLRFGDHLREHTTQLVAAREAIGAAPTMPQRMLARAEEAYGGCLGALVGLDDRFLDALPEPGEWTPRQILEHIVATQQLYLDLIREARQRAEQVETD